ncbi:MAG: T9SS type B sorting domain-containing protein [Flavitalea sp.]
MITPNDLASDYDWQLYDITGKDPNDVYTDGKMVVASNWSGETGLTGASNAGTQQFVCEGVGKPLFSVMPNVIAGHNYLLLISHFSNTQFGYDLSFKGGTAMITDVSAPRLGQAEPNCGGNVITVKLTKKIKCNSIASDGSEFFVTPSVRSAISSVGIFCSSRFDTDSIEIKFNQVLPPGNYKLNVRPGTDGNTLLDYCDNPLPTTDIADFTVLPILPTPMDSIVPLTCSPNSLKLVFSKPILCGSVATDGTDFIVSGPTPVQISGAKGNCSGGGTSSKEIIITLSQPLQQGGNFRLQLQNGSDGNSILNECGTETPAGDFVLFSLLDTVNANFSYNIQFGCVEDVIDFSHPGQNGVTQWKWNLDDNIVSTQQNPQGRYRIFDQKNIELIVSNGFCSDTARQPVLLDNFMKVDFTVLKDHCHSEPVRFHSLSTGQLTQHDWVFGDGLTGTGDSITHIYAPPAKTTEYIVKHTVTNQYGCALSIEKTITVYVNCKVDVPNAFTPNADMKNDFLYPLNAIKAEQLDFKVYNRWGQLIFQTNDWKKGWDGRYNGQLQPSGSYVWVLQYTHRDTKERVQKRGTSFLLR